MSDEDRILALDYGEHRLGYAISDFTGQIAMPLSVEEINSDTEAVASVVAKCSETGASKVIVGLPLNMNGTSGTMVEKVMGFVGRLKEALHVPVETWDERLSTCMAEKVLLSGDLSRKRRKELRDKLAAQIVLQGYMDSKRRRETDDNALEGSDIV